MDPFLGQIQPFGFNFAPRGWALCNGTLLAIAQNSALFSLLGTTYGGDGRTTFGLPDLRGRSIVHVGSGPGLSTVSWGQKSGAETVTLTQTQMPAHTHSLVNGTANVHVYTTGNEEEVNETDGGANALGSTGAMPDIYREEPTTTDSLGGVVISGTTSQAGSGHSINIRNPYLGIYVSIATVGVFPSRN